VKRFDVLKGSGSWVGLLDIIILPAVGTFFKVVGTSARQINYGKFCSLNRQL